MINILDIKTQLTKLLNSKVLKTLLAAIASDTVYNETLKNTTYFRRPRTQLLKKKKTLENTCCSRKGY